MKKLAMQRNFDDFVHSLVSVHRVAVVLNVQYPRNNQSGTFAFRVNKIVVKSDLKEVLTILKPLFDVCDSKLV